MMSNNSTGWNFGTNPIPQNSTPQPMSNYNNGSNSNVQPGNVLSQQPQQQPMMIASSSAPNSMSNSNAMTSSIPWHILIPVGTAFAGTYYMKRHQPNGMKDALTNCALTGMGSAAYYYLVSPPVTSGVNGVMSGNANNAGAGATNVNNLYSNGFKTVDYGDSRGRHEIVDDNEDD